MTVKIPVAGGGLKDKVQQASGNLLSKNSSLDFKKSSLLEKQAAFFVLSLVICRYKLLEKCKGIEIIDAEDWTVTESVKDKKFQIWMIINK